MCPGVRGAACRAPPATSSPCAGTTRRMRKSASIRARLVDVSRLDTRVTLFGQEMPFPIVLAPTGAQRFVHPEGELAVARGAAAAQATLCISSSASMKVEDIARSTKGPVWFQLYVQKDRAFTKDLVQRAEDSGCQALCVTVDSPTFGARNHEDRYKSELPERELPNLKGKDYLDPTLTWKENRPASWNRAASRAAQGHPQSGRRGDRRESWSLWHHRFEPRRS